MFWPLQSNSEVLRVPIDSQIPISRVWISSSHSLKVGLRHPAWVQSMPPHIGASCHLLRSQGHGVYTSKCNQNSLGWIPIQRVFWEIPMCTHGSSLPLASPSSTMWRHSPSNRIGQVPRMSVAQPWWHESNPPFSRAKRPQPFDLIPHQNSQV